MLRVSLCSGLKIKVNPYNVLIGFFECYCLFDGFVDLSVIYLKD